MKLTTKQILFILMSTLLVLVVIMSAIVFSRVSGLLSALSGAGSTEPQTEPSASDQIPGSSQIPSSSQVEFPTETHIHELKKDKTLSATCESSGYTLYACSCGKTDIRDFKDPLGHKYGEYTVVPATCETDGYTERICSRCKKAEHTKPVKGGHKFSGWTDAAAASGTPINEQRTCNTCKTTEIHSKNTANTWLLRKQTLESEGRFAHYRVTVLINDKETGTTYDIYTDLVNKNLALDYSKSKGLTIDYKIGEADKSHTAPATGANVLTLYVSGKVTNTTPVEDDEPGTTGPSGSTGSTGGTGSSSTGTTTTTGTQATTTTAPASSVTTEPASTAASSSAQ